MSDLSATPPVRRKPSAPDPYAAQPEPVPRLSSGRVLLGALLLFVVCLAAYWPALGGELVYDDHYIVAQNPQIADWSGVWTSFTSSYWEFLDAETRDRVGYYRPLSGALLTICYQFGGTDPAIYHWLNLLLHVAACAAAWRLGARLFRSQQVGLAGALLFALHPLHVESVAWISALHDPLYAVFGFVALERFLAWREDGEQSMPWIAGLAFFGALLSKEAALALIPVALVLDFGRRRYDRKSAALALGPVQRLARAYAPFACALLVYLGMRILTYGDLLAGLDKQTTDFGVPLARLMELRIELLGGALALIAWPDVPNLFRPFHPILPDGALLVPLIAIAVWGTLTVVSALRKWRPALGLLLILPAAIAPVLLRVESVGTFPLSDRFLYLSVIGFTLWFAGLAFRFLPSGVGWAVMVATALTYGVQTFRYASVWVNEDALFTDALEKNPRNPNVYWSLGRVHLERYRLAGDTRELAQARSYFEQGMDLLEAAAKTDFAIFATKDDHLQMNLGLAFALIYEEQNGEFKSFDVPARIFQDVTVRYPDSERGFIGLGVARMLQGRHAVARAQFERALEINPRSPEAHNNLGQLALQARAFGAAEEHFREATTYTTGGLQAWMGLAHALNGQDRKREAFEAAEHAYRANPAAPAPCLMLGTLAAEAEDDAVALIWLQRALERDPHNAETHFTLSQIHTRAGRFDEAAKELNLTLRAQRDHFWALHNLGLLILESDSGGSETRALHPLVGAYHYRPAGPVGAALRARLVELSERHIGLGYRLAVVDLELGDLASAEQWARGALATSPDNAAIHQVLGFILIAQERFADARDHALIAANTHVTDYDAQNAAAKVLLATGELEIALVYLRRTLDLLPRQPLEEGLKDVIRKGLEKAVADAEAASNQ